MQQHFDKKQKESIVLHLCKSQGREERIEFGLI